MKKTEFAAIGAIVGVVLALTGCESLAGFADVIRKPEARVIDVEIVHLSFESIRIQFSVEITNPNSVGVELAGFDYQFDIDGTPFLEGVVDERVALAPGGTSVIPVPVEFGFAELIQGISHLADQNESGYRITVGLTFQLPILDKVRVAVTKEGTLPVVKLPRVAVQRLQLQRLTLRGADLVLGLEIGNPNGFLIDLTSLDYRFGIAGQQWASGAMRRRLAVASGGIARVDLPITLSFAAVGQSVRRVLSGGTPLGYDLSVDMGLGTDHPLLPTARLSFDRSGEIGLTR